MGTLKAPFNFVPLNEKVYFPEWAERVSHDIPFEDGMCGTVNVRITAESPIFVSDGRSSKGDSAKCPLSFSTTPDGTYFIPATSVKGMVRSVFETMSYGKMTMVQQHSFSIRDLSDGKDGKFYRAKIKPCNIHCGWMRMEGFGSYVIEDCGTPWRISADELERKFHVGFSDFVRKGNFKDDNNRTAKRKYEMFKDWPLTWRFSEDETSKVANRYIFDDSGAEGTIVFTGQPGARKESVGKFWEFVFPKKESPVELTVSQATFNEFSTIHKDSPDYEGWRRKQLLAGERIPVFFMYKERNQHEVDSIGLSYMYRYPAFTSVYAAMSSDHLDRQRLDLADCVFGTTQGVSGALRGRVRFSHAMAVGAPTVLAQQSYILSSPHPSYYPLYLGNGQTWNSQDVRLAGRKRYPVRDRLMQSTEGTGDMLSQFEPLDRGAQFVCKVRFHNLRRVELGALLSALTFHRHADCYHSLGMGKPYGFGKVRVEVEGIDATPYLQAFEAEMNRFSGNKWSRDLDELYAMARGIRAEREGKFEYMRMSTSSADNEFKAAKAAYAEGEQLGRFTQILEDKVPKASFVGNADPTAERPNIEEQMERQRLKAEERRQEEQRKAEQRRQEEQRKEEQRRQEEQRKAEEQLKAELRRQAKEHEDAKQYGEALKCYEELDKMGENVYDEMERCRQRLTMGTQTFADFLGELKLSSPNAFENRLKKWKQEHGDFCDVELAQIASKVKAHLANPSLTSKDRKRWQNFDINKI